MILLSISMLTFTFRNRYYRICSHFVNFAVVLSVDFRQASLTVFNRSSTKIRHRDHGLVTHDQIIILQCSISVCNKTSLCILRRLRNPHNLLVSFSQLASYVFLRKPLSSQVEIEEIVWKFSRTAVSAFGSKSNKQNVRDKIEKSGIQMQSSCFFFLLKCNIRYHQIL